MPSVLDAPECIEQVETYDLHIEKPRARGAHPGFWRMLAHGIAKHLTRTPRASHAPLCSAHHPFEAPMDRLVREHPSLAILALSII